MSNSDKLLPATENRPEPSMWTVNLFKWWTANGREILFLEYEVRARFYCMFRKFKCKNVYPKLLHNINENGMQNKNFDRPTNRPVQLRIQIVRNQLTYMNNEHVLFVGGIGLLKSVNWLLN